MRILMISNLCPPYCIGGYEIACFNVARAMSQRGHDVRMLTTPSHVGGEPDPAYIERSLDLRHFAPYRLPQADISALRVHESICSQYGNTATLIRALRTFDPDIVYCWNLVGLGGLALLDVLNMVGVPWAMHLMDRVPVELMQGVPVPVLHVFNASNSDLYGEATVIAMSQHLVDEIEELVGITFKGSTHIVPGWVDMVGTGDRTDYQPNGITRFVNAGAVVPHKGIDLILEAAADLLSRDLDRFRIDIIGEGQIANYVDKAMTLGVSGHVSFLGERRQEELLTMYKDYDVFLFPTWEREPFGFTPIEAAAKGCVAIMTANCGVAERLVDRVHCLKIERSVEDLATKMAETIEGKVDLRRIGSAAAALVRSDLSFDRCVDALERILRPAARAWDRRRIEDEKLMLVIYLKHHLSMNLRFNPAA